jgi:hypothetical protein
MENGPARIPTRNNDAPLRQYGSTCPLKTECPKVADTVVKVGSDRSMSHSFQSLC